MILSTISDTVGIQRRSEVRYHKGITLDVIEEGDGVFVNGIEGIVCFADGSSRAWDFTVNGRSTGRDSANSPIKGGDVIVWRYAGI